MVAELAADATLVAVENDPERFQAAAQKLVGTRAEMVLGDWRVKSSTAPSVPSAGLISSVF